MKKTVKLILILTVILMCLGLTACGGSSTAEVELAPYLSVSYTGYNGNGTAHVDFDFADFEYAVMSQWDGKDTLENLAELTAVEMTISYAADVSEGLRNGDTITIKIRFDEEKAKACGYRFTGLEKKFTVEGLAEPILIDPFADEIFGNGKTVNVLLEGTDPFINLYMNNCAAANDPVHHIVYQSDKSWNLQNGDVITVTASLDKRFQNQGYLLTRTETTIIVDGFDRHASAVSDLTQEVLTAMSDRAYQECVNGGSVDIYDGNNNLWPWGARFENIHVGDTALLAVNREIDAEYSFLLVPVYKTITTDTWYDMDAAMNITRTWENVVSYYKFSDVVVHPDGSVTFYEDYVAMNGNYTDAEVADALYLNELRANYSLLEVPMP